MARKQDKMTFREYAGAIAGVARLSFRFAPWPLTFKLIGIFISAGLPIIVTYFAAQTTTALADAFTGNEAAGDRAIRLIIATAALGLVATAWRSVSQYADAFIRYRIESKVGDMLYEHFLSLEFWRYDDKETADLYDRAQKFSKFYAYVFNRLGDIITQLVGVVFSLGALVLFMPWLAAIILIAIIPGMYIQLKISRAQIEHWNNTVDHRRARSYIEWNLLQPGSIAELRLNGLVKHLLRLRGKYRDHDEKVWLEYERSFVGKRLLADALQAVTELAALVWIAMQIINRSQPLGQFVYVQQLVSRAISSANNFVQQLSTMDEDLANLFDYRKFMELPVGSTSGRKLKQAPSIIAFSHVSFRYPKSETDILQDVTFQITQGQHVAIVGENGAGKSTLIKLLTGLYPPTAGTIQLDGIPLQEIDNASWHRQLAVLHQDFERYVFTDVENNVYFGNVDHPLNPEQLQGALKKAEAKEFIDELPQKLKTPLSQWMEDKDGNKGVQLSGGQWQRLALARSFYRDASIIILDEPTSAIDAVAESRIFKHLFAKSNAKTVITISHRMSTTEKADHIIVLKHGRIVEAGRHAELIANKGEYYTMFKEQLREGHA